jgi:RNA polymerase sigma-70 factor (ECF subfamily)
MGLPGSPRPVQRLVEDHYQALYRYAYRLVGSAADADDLTQEAFCKAQMNFGQLRDAQRARAWLFRILRNVYLHKVRAAKHQHCISLDDMSEVPDRPAEPLPPVDPHLLQEALNELPEVFRTPIILYYFEDFSYRDIAEQMDLPLGTVMSRLARAKAHLRTRLAPLAPEAVADGRRRATNGL